MVLPVLTSQTHGLPYLPAQQLLFLGGSLDDNPPGGVGSMLDWPYFQPLSTGHPPPTSASHPGAGWTVHRLQ